MIRPEPTGRPTRRPTRRSSGGRAAIVAVSVTVASLLAACSSTTESRSSSTKPTITIVTYSSYVLDDAVKKQVETELGVTLKVNGSGDGAEALAGAILTAGRPEGDVFFGVDNTLLTRAIDSDVLDRMSTAELPNLASVPKELQLDASGRLVPVDVGPVCVDYDAQWFTEHGLAPPTSLQDLTDPRYRDLLVVESPVTSSTGLTFLMGTHAELGDGTDAFWRALQANGMAVAASWDDAWNLQYTGSGKGDRPLVVSYATSPPAEVVYSDGKVTSPRTAVVTDTCTDQVEFAGVLRGTKQRALAVKVVNAMLGEHWQASLPLSNFVYPARTGVTIPGVFTQFAPKPPASITLDPKVVATNRDRWIDAWRSIVE